MGVQARKIDYPVVIDNDFAVWRAFANNILDAVAEHGGAGAQPQEFSK